jgi:hypothetical protein
MRSLILFSVLLSSAVPAVAQTAPPIHGVTGTYVPEETVKGEHEGAHGIAAGVGKVVGKVLPGGKGENPLNGFKEGMTVTLRDGDGSTEGVVIDLNRSKQQMTVRIAPKKTETLRVVQPGGKANVAVSYTEPSGAKIVRDFARVS